MATTPRLSSRDPKETDAIARLRTINPDEKPVEVEVEKEPELKVEVEGEEAPKVEPAKVEAVEPKVEEPKVEPRVETKPDEGVETLKKQIEELKAYRATENQRTQAAIQEAQQRAREAELYRRQAYDSQYDSIVNTLAASQLEADTAKQQYAIASSVQDHAAMAEAMDRLAKAHTSIARLEDGKRAYEDERNRPQPQPQPQQQASLLPQEEVWLNSHPEVRTNPILMQRADAAYHVAMARGIPRGSPEYFAIIEQELGYKANSTLTSNLEPRESNQAAIVSAPVARESRSMSGEPTKPRTYRLTKEQAEVAKMSGLTYQEYAKQLEKLEEMKRADPERYYGRS